MSRLGKQLRRRLWIFGGGLVGIALCMHATAVELSAAWRTGEDFQRALSARLSNVVFSAGTPVRSALDGLSRTQRVAILLDRRIDPDSCIELNAHDKTLAQVLDQLAAQCEAVPSYVGSVVYLGPRSTANLARVAQERQRDAQQLPRPISQRLLAARPWTWDELAEPRELVEQWAKQTNITVEGLELIPHDLWPGGDLPSLSGTDRLTLVLTGFDLTFTFEDQGRRLRLVPYPTQDPIVRSYPTTLNQVQIEGIAALFPNAKIESSAGGITLEGTLEEHDRLQRILQQQVRKKPSRGAQGRTVHTLRVDRQPVGAILKTLEKQLELQFRFESGAAERLQMRVTFDVRDVSLDELLAKTLAPAGLAFQRDGTVVTISQRDQ